MQYDASPSMTGLAQRVGLRRFVQREGAPDRGLGVPRVNQLRNRPQVRAGG